VLCRAVAWLHTLLASPVDGSEWSASCPKAITRQVIILNILLNFWDILIFRCVFSKIEIVDTINRTLELHSYRNRLLHMGFNCNETNTRKKIIMYRISDETKPCHTTMYDLGSLPYMVTAAEAVVQQNNTTFLSRRDTDIIYFTFYHTSLLTHATHMFISCTLTHRRIHIHNSQHSSSDSVAKQHPSAGNCNSGKAVVSDLQFR
jgi:hypothetical protein